MPIRPKIEPFAPQSWLIVAALLGILVLHLALVFGDAGRFRAQHLGTALLYAKGSVDLMHPVIVGFNATGTPTPLEFPLWQALTGAVMKFFGTWWGWGNVVSWALFATCIAPFYRLAERHLGPDAAGWATLALLLQPLIVVQAGQAGTDGTALAAGIWLVCLIDRMVTDGSWRVCAITALFAAVSATQKLPFFMAAGIAGIGLVSMHRPFAWRRWLQLGLIGAAGAGVFFFWNAHAVQEFSRAEFPFVDLRANTPAMQDWYFGNLSYRLDPRNWIRGGYRIATGLLGSFLLLPLVGWAALDRRQRLAHWWLAGAMVTTLVFTHLVLHHWHYYLMVSPAFALLVGGGLATVATWAPAEVRARRWVIPSLGALCLTLASVQGLNSGHFLMRDDFAKNTARLVAQQTSPDDKLVIVGGDWGGLELILSNRQGFTVDDPAIFADTTKLARLRSLGYTKLVLLSQSPKGSAVAIVGGSQKARPTWPSLVNPSVAGYSVIFENDDLSIRLLPTR